MNVRLVEISEKFAAGMKMVPGVLGAWNFGSLSRKTSDKFSDADLVFLIDEAYYFEIDHQVLQLVEGVCDRILLIWPEKFNGDTIKNYGCILEENGELLQFDIFLMNEAKIRGDFCRIHYAGLKEEDVLFDTKGRVRELMSASSTLPRWSGDTQRDISTYWFHGNMSSKYLIRKDFFKLQEVMQIMMDAHSSLILTAYDKIDWGSRADKLRFVDKEYKAHLKLYGCSEDWGIIRENLIKSMEWFYNDEEVICREIGIMHDKEIGKSIIGNWKKIIRMEDTE